MVYTQNKIGKIINEGEEVLFSHKRCSHRPIDITANQHKRLRSSPCFVLRKGLPMMLTHYTPLTYTIGWCYLPNSHLMIKALIHKV
jgi:hypothetical protein